MLHLLFAAAAALPAVPEPEPEPQKVVVLAARDSEWASYRQAYKTTASMAPLLASRPLIQVHMQIRPREPGLSVEGLQIMLEGATTRVAIPVDAIGRSTVPLLKQAYDEDAVLRLNRLKGSYRFSGRFSIRERDDGIYSAAALREACGQMLSVQREFGSRLRLFGKKCTGVKFVYRMAEAGAGIVFRDRRGVEAPIGAVEGHAFDIAELGQYKIVTYRFGDWPAEGDLLARQPLAIGGLYE